MKIVQPADGAALPIAHPVVFSGTASAGVARVVLVADGKYPVGETLVANGAWTVARQFSAGDRRVVSVRGLDSGGAIVEQSSVTINLRPPHDFGYTPPGAVLPHLGKIAADLEVATPVPVHFEGLERMFNLPGGPLYFDSDLDLDTDGERDPGIVYERTHQDKTSLAYPSGRYLNANKTGFFVLPGGFYRGYGIHLGDIGAVLYKDRLCFGVFGDVGPSDKIGEGSIAMHRALGFERVRPDGQIRDLGIGGGVITIVFPNSGDGTPQTAEAIQSMGEQLFQSIGGVLKPHR